MLLRLDEYPFHQITDTFAAVAGSDPQWNDGHYVCCADQAGTVALTSNAGARELARAKIGFGDSVNFGADDTAYKNLFSPEFRNRLDGRIQFANLSAQAVSALQPELALLYAPFLFDDEAEADYVYDHYLTGYYRRLLAEKDIHLVTWYEIGFVGSARWTK